MGNRTATLLLVVVVILGVAWLVNWLETRFGAQAALFALILLFLLATFGIFYGMFRGMYTAVGQQTKGTMDLLIDFGQKDAMTDRYRSQTTLEAARGVNVDQRITLLDRQQERDLYREQRRLEQRRALMAPPDEGYGEQQPRLGYGGQWQQGQRAEENYQEYD